MDTVTCLRCQYQGPLDNFAPNLTSVHNPIRCLQCGSTNNDYNRVHSRLMTKVIKGEVNGPVTVEQVFEGMRETDTNQPCD